MPDKKMKPEVKALWLEALRSDEYDQGKGQLTIVPHNEDGEPEFDKVRHCCLGVLCEVAIKAGVQIEKVYSLVDSQGYLYDGEGCYLPESVVTWAGLPDCAPRVQATEDDAESLTALNDGESQVTYAPAWSFSQIADAIEASL